MATLNIKNFPDRLYRRIKQRAGRNRRSMAQEVVQLLDEAGTRISPIMARSTARIFVTTASPLRVRANSGERRCRGLGTGFTSPPANRASTRI